MLLKIVVLIVAGLCIGRLVPVYRKRCRKKQISKAIVALAAMPLDRIPDVASGFARYVREAHGVDLGGWADLRSTAIVLINGAFCQNAVKMP